MDELIESLSLEQLSLAFQVLGAEKFKQVSIPQELQWLSQEDWTKLDYLLDEVMKEKAQSSVH